MNFLPDSTPPLTSIPTNAPLPPLKYFLDLSAISPSWSVGYITLSTFLCFFKKATVFSALEQCCFILNGTVSRPCIIPQALSGAKGAPKSLNKQTLALTAKETFAPVNCGTTSPHFAPP